MAAVVVVAEGIVHCVRHVVLFAHFGERSPTILRLGPATAARFEDRPAILLPSFFAQSHPCKFERVMDSKL